MKTEKLIELLNFGIIVIDKPSGPTSFSVSDFIRQKLGLKKTSHFGTLDPAVTGVLPIALGRAVKLTGFFLGHNKEYIGVMHVHNKISIKELQKIIDEKFIGKIKQMPPIKSRVRRQEREREIKSFEVLEKDKKDFLFKTEVQGGTYIRKLIHDLGLFIGGAHMLELRRSKAGIFFETQSFSLYEFDNAVDEWKKGNDKLLKEMIIPAEEAIKKIMPVIQVNEKSVKKLLTGKPLFKEDINGNLPDTLFAVFSNGRFIEIARKVNENEIIGKAEFVFN